MFEVWILKCAQSSDLCRIKMLMFRKVVLGAPTVKSLLQVRQTSQCLLFIDSNIIVIKRTGSFVIFAFVSFFFFFA